MPTITKKELIRLIKRGWRGRKWCSFMYWSENGMSETGDSFKAVYACAMGAAALAAQYQSPYRFVNDFIGDGGLGGAIADANNQAGSKAAAIRAIEKLNWNKLRAS